jgi:peptidyl-prolyl cis-trans isomerase A (cyclophilin A)
MNRIKLVAAITLLIALLSGCHKLGTWEQQERSQIEKYIKNLGDTAYILEPSGLYYIQLKEGTGKMPVNKDTVFFRYSGMFLDRIVFDSNLSSSTPYPAVLGYYQIIPGLDEGIHYMKIGEKARFLTPSNLAYGSTGVWGAIPGFTPLLWEIELVDIHSGPAGVK